MEFCFKSVVIFDKFVGIYPAMASLFLLYYYFNKENVM